MRGPLHRRHRYVVARLVVSGYYGFDNFGDEAILSVFVDEWRRRRAGDEIVVLSHQPEITARRYGVRAAPRMDRRAVRAELHATDVLVSGGGGLLQSATSLRSLAYYLWVIREAIRLNKRATIFAQGIGPLSYFGRQLVKRACARLKLASVRDEASLALLRALLPGADVRLCADPVFLAPTQSSPEALARLAREGVRTSTGDLVAIVVRRGPLLDRLIDDLAAAVDRLERVHGMQVVFVPLQVPDDADAAVSVIRRCKTAPVLLVGGYDVDAMNALLSRCAALISMRLHALILAARLGLPFVALPHDPKNIALVRELDYPLPAAARVGHLQPAVDELLARRAELHDRLLSGVEPLISRARLAFDWLAEFAQGL